MRGRRGHEDDGWDRRDDAGRYPGPRGFDEQQDFGNDPAATQQFDARELGGKQQYDRSPYDGRAAEPRQYEGRRYDGGQQGASQHSSGPHSSGPHGSGQQGASQHGASQHGASQYGAGAQGANPLDASTPNGGRNNGARYDRSSSARHGYPAQGSPASAGGPDAAAHGLGHGLAQGANPAAGMDQSAGRELTPATSSAARSRPYGRISIFTLLDDKVAEFDRLAEQVADAVRIAEPDTLVYVIHLVPKAPMQRIFYEIYRDRAAFDSHERQPHNQRFATERRSCVLATNIIELRLKYAKVAPLSPGGQGQRSGQQRQQAAPATDRRMPQPGWGQAQPQPGPGAYGNRYGEG